MSKTKINWADMVWNPVRGCTRVSEGCRNCYAEAMAGRIVAMGRGKPTPYDGLVEIKSRRQLQVDANGEPTGRFRDHGTRAYWTDKVAFDATVLAEPLKRRKPTTYFVNSMSDLFHDGFTNEQIAAVFGVMAATPQHAFILLTKRAERMREWFEWAYARPDDRLSFTQFATPAWHCNERIRWKLAWAGRMGHASSWPLPNVILGVSVENQATADERIPHLLATPAAVRAISAEPLLGPLDVRAYLSPFHDLDPMLRPVPRIGWAIAGCESGPNARPCEVDWLRSLRDQCRDAEVPFWLKQARATPYDDDREDPREVGYPPYGFTPSPIYDPIHVGPGSTRKPGDIIDLPYLDGVQWAQRPEVRR